MKKTVISTIIVSLLVIVGTVGAILYAQGYRLHNNQGMPILQETGLLALTSEPEGARVLIDGNLTTATDDTIYLDEGTYKVRVEKEGYFPWEKEVEVKNGVVSNFQIRLFPSTPKLDPITRSGAQNPIVDPSGRFITYTVPNGLVTNMGIYTLDMANRPIIPFGSATTQLVSNATGPFSTSLLSYSPNGAKILATTSAELTQTFLLNPTEPNQTPQNVTVTLNQIQQEWNEEALEVRENKIDALPSKVRDFAHSNFTDIKLSPGNEKVLYEASSSAEMPEFIENDVPGRNPTKEDRNLKKGNIYVYDTKEDKNYLIFDSTATESEKTEEQNQEQSTENQEPTSTTQDQASNLKNPTFIWHPTASYLFYTHNGKVNVIEYDGTNRTTLYAGPFQENFLYPWPDGSSLVILTNLGLSDSTPNLYSLSLE